MSRNPAHAPKSNELIERLGVVAASPRLDEVELRRIAREAQALMDVDPAGAHTLLGGVASQRGDADSARRHHSIALDVDANPTLRCNYAISLCHLDLYGEALEVAQDGLRVYPDDTDLLDQAITAAVESANFLVGRALVGRYNALFPKRPHAKSDMVGELAAAIDNGLFQEANVRAVLGIVVSVSQEAEVRVSESSISITPLEPDSFFYRRTVFATPRATSALNWAFADRIAQRPDLMKDPGLKFLVRFTGATANGI